MLAGHRANHSNSVPAETFDPRNVHNVYSISGVYPDSDRVETHK